MKVLIIGAGWYGCHLASYLMSSGISVNIVDKNNSIFSGSSLKNQNRLHLGYHYPRSDSTIIECKKGYNKFLEVYHFLTECVPLNLYSISSKDSIINDCTYIHKITNHDLATTKYTGDMPLGIKLIEQPIHVDERYINPFKSQQYFKELLEKYLIPIDNSDIFTSIDAIVKHLNKEYDYIINCTYNMLEPIDYEHYELFITLLYKIESPKLFAYTIMDGPFFSIYPYDISENIYTVTSVVHGVLYKGRTTSYVESSVDIENIKTNMTKQILEYIPSWETCASYVGYYSSWKTKHDTVSDDRSVRYTVNGDRISMYGGKITGIFEAERIVKEVLCI